MIETLALSIALAVALTFYRRALALIRSVWRDARAWERVALCLALAPIPGPVDEILGLLVIRRVIARREEVSR